MKLSRIAIVTACLALCGCSTAVLDRTNSVVDYFGLGDDDEAAPPGRTNADETPAALSTVPPQTTRAENFCKGFAESERWKSQQLGSSPENQRHDADIAYRECMDGSSHWID